jgi:hypothetical protein
MDNNPIQFAFQNWNTEYGWWAPNTVPADFMVNGVKTLPSTHEIQWFDVGVFSNIEKSKQEAFNYPVIKSDFLYNSGGVWYTHLPDLVGQRKYIFPVCIRDTYYFTNQRDTGFDLVDPRVMVDVRAGRAKIVLMFPLEGTSADFTHEDDFATLDSWCKKYNLKRDQVYYIHGNYKGADLTRDMDFTYIPINSFYCWVPYIPPTISEYNPVDDKNLFLSYNRRPRLHRTVLLCELIRNGLLNKGMVSYHGDFQKNAVQIVSNHGRKDLYREAQALDEMIPMELDMDLGANNPAWNIVPEHYARTVLSVVPETLYGPLTNFFSEKIWKTIAVGHPFMMVSSPGMLAELRREGYYTFGSFWDESYDSMPNLYDRITAIVKELKRLSTLTPEQLKNMRERMRPILEHNQELFRQQWVKRCQRHPDTQLYDIVKSIWDSF